MSTMASFMRIVDPVRNPTDHDRVRAWGRLVEGMVKHAAALGVYERTQEGENGDISVGSRYGTLR